jgi:probable phosphoglycerate mutase
MTTFLLIRHGHTDLVGNTLAGRSEGVHLSVQGEREVAELTRRIRDFEITAVFSSPLERTRETARPLADALGLEVMVREDLNEIDYGLWTGMKMSSLAEDPAWARYNRFRSGTGIPGGEWFVDVQARVVRLLEELRAEHPHETLAVVSHGDVIRVALAHGLGMHLDLITRIVIRPASVSGLLLSEFDPEILFVNRMLWVNPNDGP